VIDLFRSEFLYLERNSLPDEEEQYQAYRAVAEVAGELLGPPLESPADCPVSG